MRYLIIGTLGVFLFAGVARAAGELELKTETQRINYSVGYQIGKDFKAQGVELDSPALVHGIRDALQDARTKMTDEEMHTTLVELKKKILVLQEEQRKAQAEKFRAEGKKFLEENARKEGVVSLPSGMQYMILKQGSGRQPTAKDTVTVKYRGATTEGNGLENTEGEQKPVTLTLANAIPGWQEALKMMKEGGKWRLFIPPNLAFGSQGPMADRTVVYDIELVSVQP